MDELLKRLEHWLAEHRKRYLSKGLRPGAAKAALDKLEKALGLPVPAELRTLLGWHDGQKVGSVGRFEENWLLMSAERIVAAAADLNERAEETGWGPKWVPFLDDDEGDYLCLDTGKQPAPVRAYYLANTEHKVIAPSLQAWLEDFVTAVEAGLYHEEPERGAFMRKNQAK
jgi:cell wall assembly regulator SMI1